MLFGDEDMLLLYQNPIPAIMKKWLTATITILLCYSATAQLKIGSNPSTINKSSILELESTRQGLLLPRIPGANMSSAPLSTAPDGMIIYVTDSASLFIRRNGLWQRMSSDSVGTHANWNTLGNAGLDSTVNFLGTTDAQPVIFKTNGAQRLAITSNGNLQAANGTIPAATNQVQVLVIDPATGTILQRTIANAAFDNAIVSLNGLRDSVQTFKMDSAVSADPTITSAAGVHTFNIPFQDGSGAVYHGLLSYADWKRFDSSARSQILSTAFSNTPNDTALTISGTALVLHAADGTHPGAVNVGAQTFGGDKNFKDSLSIGLTQGTAANSTFQVNGSLSTNITKVSANYSVSTGDNTVLADATSGAITITLPAPGSISGRIYTIKKIGTGGIDNALTINPTSGTIDGGTNYIIYNDWTFVCLQTDGTNWYVIKK